MVSINQLVNIVASTANKNITINHIDGPLGVRGRNSNNELIRSVLGGILPIAYLKVLKRPMIGLKVKY